MNEPSLEDILDEFYKKTNNVNRKEYLKQRTATVEKITFRFIIENTPKITDSIDRSLRGNTIRG